MQPVFSRQSGFSLVELSIVLVILGLLVGGVLGGQSLIRAAELRAVSTEYTQWLTAINSFRMKYSALPGDMKTATRFWGEYSGCGTNGAGGNDTPGYLGGDAMNGTCNGDGNGRVTNNNIGTYDYERFLFWQHLSLAGVIPGHYTGVRGPNIRYHHIAGENAPRSKLGGAGWTVRSRNTGYTGMWMQYDHQNILQIVAFSGSDGLPQGQIFTPEEAWGIDSKVDDGKPGTGYALAAPISNNCSTTTGPTDYDGEYNLHLNEVLCTIYFSRSF